jgi:type II secretory pathway pseudopilin PulG
MGIYKRQLKIKTAKAHDADAGFTLIEVILAAIILMAFVAISAQSIVLSQFIRIKAQERARANQAIQEDVELLRLISADNSSINPNAKTCAATTANTGYANSLQTNFTTFKTSYSSTYGAIDNSFTSENVSFSSNNFNYRIRLRRQIETSTNDSSINFKALRIRYRVETTKKSANSNAFNIECNYSNNCVLDDYIEVIPNVALRCP